MFDGKRMLEMLRGKRVVLVDDSLHRNTWESLVCALREALVNKNGVFEVSGRTEFKTEGFYSFIFRTEVAEAITKALRTWAQWVDANVDPSRSRVFFRGCSASHFKGGQWNSGGSCDGEIRPMTNETHLSPYPWMMSIVENVISEMKIPVLYLNITKMTDYRKDGHPSIYRIAGNQRSPGMDQDCSH
ncbi:PC-Esterase [Dillenia turbinata]|uniref:PC-Esterase n=1 Tax=Dillenia turbinata TaxID=194707 RepID=A0AAN8UM31_9MAGN